MPSEGNKRRTWSCFSGDENDLKFGNGHKMNTVKKSHSKWMDCMAIPH